jgi:hypothetical protein
MFAPGTNLPLLWVNQNLVVTAGSTRAWKTSAGGLRMSIPTLTVGIWLSWRLSLNMVTYLSGTSCSSLTCAQVRLD